MCLTAPVGLSVTKNIYMYASLPSPTVHTAEYLKVTLVENATRSVAVWPQHCNIVVTSYLAREEATHADDAENVEDS